MGCVLALGFLLATPAEGRVRSEGPPAALTLAGLSQALDPSGVEAYWTADRMRSALPLGLDEVGDAITPGSPAPRSTNRAVALTAPRSVGKLFFTTPQGNAVCSAASVNTAEKNVVITAAHCAHSGMPKACGLLRTCPGQYYTNFLFVPRYANGAAPDGKWVGTRAITHQQWITSEDLVFDQALIEVAPRNGINLVSVVGGNGLAWGYPATESDIRVWGWPAEGAYDGETVQRCVGNTTPFDSSGDAKLSCPLTGGASGGPWFISMANANVGFIWAVTSRRTVNGPPLLIAHPLGRSILTLLSVARSSRAAVPASARAASASSISLRAVPQRVGRGQLVRLRSRTSASTRVVLGVRYSARGAWHRVEVKRTGRDGIVEFQQKPARVGLRWYRVRTATASAIVRVRVYPCPLPVDRTPAVVDATACTAPVG